MRKIIFSLVFSFLFLTYAGSVSAHVLKSDGSIGAVIHVTPEDDPIAGEPASFLFEFKDKENKFDASKCDCKITIINGGQELTSQPLFNSSTTTVDLNTPVFNYIFPKKGVYTVRVTGQPINGASFQTFKLSYDLRIERESTNPTANTTQTTAGNSSLKYILFGGAAGVIILAVLVNKFRKNIN